MSTLVLCVDRSNAIGQAAGRSTPIVGWEAVRSLVIDVGLADPESASVNSILEALRVTRELRESGDEAVVAVISGTSDSIVSADRAVATQLDELIAEHQPSAAVMIVDSAHDEQLIPVVESRIPVDAVDRVVVRQARDIESTYYLLKQFLADEELRQTTLIPIGVTLLAFPLLVTQTSPGIALATITAVIGLFLLYKGLGVDEYLAQLPGWTKRSLYSGRVSIVTYVVAAGLVAIGIFAGALGASTVDGEPGTFLVLMQFTFDSVPWLATGALVGSLGRLIDEALRDGYVPGPYLNIPFGIVALGVVIRGFAGYFLQQGTQLDAIVVPTVQAGPLSIEPFVLTPGQRLAMFVVVGMVISLTGVRVATYFGDLNTGEFETAESLEQ